MFLMRASPRHSLQADSPWCRRSQPNRPTASPLPQSSTLQSFSSSSIPAAPAAPPSRPTFGVDLGEQMARDNVDVPRVLEKCAQAIELHGLDSMGIYRLSGTTSRVQRLKAALDRGPSRSLLSRAHWREPVRLTTLRPRARRPRGD